jgi:uncharacterized membrane protein YccC
MTALVQEPRAQRVRLRVRERLDGIIGFDPGFNQLVTAGGVAAGVSVSLGLIYLYAQIFHPMWAPLPPHASPRIAAEIGLQHHGYTLLAMLIGGLVGMISAFAMADTKVRSLALSFAVLPIPMLIAIWVAVQFLHLHTLGIVVMAVVIGAGAYMPRFTPRIGPRAFILGQMLFIGYILGFLSRGEITSGDLGPVAGILWTSCAINFLLKVLIFLPLRRGALMRTIRAFFARGRGVIVAAASMYEAETDAERERAKRRLRARLNRLNEAALIGDALLGEHATIAEEAHGRLFQAELALQNIGRLSEFLLESKIPAEVRRAVGACLAEVRDSHAASVGPQLQTLRRFGSDPAAMREHPLDAGRVIRLADALVGVHLVAGRWANEITPQEEVDAEQRFEPPVMLVFGNLPGSALVSQGAATLPGSWRSRLRLDPPLQAALRLGTAVLAAGLIGSILSERRFYWAVLAVFVSYMGANTSGEQIFKALNRVVGTVIGIFVGGLLAHAIGDSTWSVLVVVLALSGGIYFMRAAYFLMVIGITITVSQLYVQLGEYSNSLLVLRLEETAIGAAIAMVAALVVFPLRTRQATRVAARGYYTQLLALIDQLIARLEHDPDADRSPSTTARLLDSAYQQLRSAAAPLSRTPFRRDEMEHNMLLFAQAAHHARNVALQLQEGINPSAQVGDASLGTLRTQRRLVATLAQLLELGLNSSPSPAIAQESGRAVALAADVRRTGDLLGLALQDSGTPDERRLIRHLARLGETLAELADNLTETDWAASREDLSPPAPRPPQAAQLTPTA